ncbi:maleylpyruvate isomerase family mycothiol-dependent enzyme [Aeromicrobium sp. CF4.19]|uniref:maleylpyruvate isomerase family mycothiol-dependent enzyme n=1 Tax=Aeromicrobium sp. CF4.19 TaxID=3373082 RepID=UPI003EE56A1A
MGARVDLATDPDVVQDLATVRAGTAYFRRVLNGLSDGDLADESLLPGWSRKHVVAHVGYNARGIARLTQWAATGVETPMYSSPDARGREIEEGATLNPEALRHLCEHSAIDLDVRWRDLPDERWRSEVVTAQGRTVPASETIWMRIREVWLHAIDLDAGGRLVDVPPTVLTRLLGDITGAWTARGEGAGLGVVLEAGVVLGDPDAELRVSGSLPELARWATGRGVATDLDWTGAPLPAPRWI